VTSAGESAAARQRQAYAFAWLTVLCWATVSTAFKFALAELHYAQLLLVCNAVAVLVLGSLLALRGQLLGVRHLPRSEHLSALGLG